jgi:adenylate cyclase
LIVVRPALWPVGRRGSGRRLSVVDQQGGPTVSRGSWHSSASAGIQPALASYLDGQDHTGVYRSASIGCVTYSGTRRLLRDGGPGALSRAIDELTAELHVVADEYELTWLGSEVEGDVGRVTLAAGLPIPAADDAERLMNGLRVAMTCSGGPLELRGGVDRGRVFAADVGSESRRAYMVVGDAVGVATRLARQAEAGRVLASRPVVADAPVGVPA